MPHHEEEKQAEQVQETMTEANEVPVSEELSDKDLEEVAGGSCVDSNGLSPRLGSAPCASS